MSKIAKILTVMLIFVSTCMSAVLFEVKNSTGRVIMEVADDGLRIFNPSAPTTKPDTIMVISAYNITANVSSELSRDFDIADAGSTRGRAPSSTLMKLSAKPGFGVGGDSAVVFYKPKNAFRTNSILQDVNKVGDGSFAAGYVCEASGKTSTAFGYKSVASNYYATSTGYQNISSGTSSFTSGAHNEASAFISTALGGYTKALGQYSTAMGQRTVASGVMSTAIGFKTEAKSLSSLAAGRYNKIEGSSGSWVDTDPLFVLGNGTSETSLSNAFEVKKNGNTYIPTLYSTTSANSKKTVLVDSEGKLCVMSAKDDVANTVDVEMLKSENDELKVRVAKLEALVEQLLKK